MSTSMPPATTPTPPPNKQATQSTPTAPHNRSTRILDTVILVAAIALAAVVINLATFSHVTPQNPKPALVATLCTVLGCVPGIWLGTLLSNGAATQLAAVAWRLATLLPCIALSRMWIEDERNCYLMTLMACYFVALPLESWLQIRDVKRQENSCEHSPADSSR